MSYAEQYNKAKEGGKVEEVTTSIHKFEEEGEQLIGKVVNIVPFTEGEFDTEVKCYHIDTDNGRVSTVLGSATDKQLDNLDIKGKLVCITYHGKKTLTDGRQANIYQVEVF